MFTIEQLRDMAIDLDAAARALEGKECGCAWDNIVVVRQAIYNELKPLTDKILYPNGPEPECAYCGTPLMLDISIGRGYCDDCALEVESE